jgi:D,D-heptose 1,7-bisphosphate phosphatase
MNTKAIFIDKDGTLVEDVPYNIDPNKITLCEGAIPGLRLLNKQGYKIILVSNQSGIARGKFTEADLEPVKQHIQKLFNKAGISMDGFYYCPHHPEGKVRQYSVNCFCRKPNPGLLFQAARENEINLANSWMIGDILDDIEAGQRAECRTVLIDNGNETEWKLNAIRSPHFKAADLLEAANTILTEDARLMQYAQRVTLPSKGTRINSSVSQVR